MVWHPVDTLLSYVWMLPKPGTSEPFAEIRWLEVTMDGKKVFRFRVVTWAEPRRLIGYYTELRDAAADAYKHGLVELTPKSDFGYYNPEKTPQQPSEE